MKVAARIPATGNVISRQTAGATMRPALLLAALALLAAPAAAEVSVDATGPEHPVPPETATPLVLEVAVDCLTLWSREVVTVGFGVTVPENVTVDGPAEAVYHKTDCPSPDGEAVKQHTFQAVVHRHARAGVALPVHLKATLPGDALGPESFGVAQVDLVPAHVPAVQVKVAQQIKQTGSGSATYRVEVENLGNDDVDVALRVAEAPGHGGRVDLPDPVRLPMGERVELDVTLRFDHDSWDAVTTRIAVDATRVGTDETQELSASVLLRNGSLTAKARDVPGPATPLLPLALLGAALAARRR